MVAGLVQLSLDDMLTCPTCGSEFAVRDAVRRAKLAMLPTPTREVWQAAGPDFRRGSVCLGPSDLAAKANRSKSTAAYHLDILVQAGLVRKIPQNKYRRVRHLYSGAVAI